MAAAGAAFILAGCETDQQTVTGNGKVVIETREIAPFNHIEVEGNYMVVYKKGTATSLTVNADENLQPLIETVVDGQTLKVKNKRGYVLAGSSTIIVRVSSPAVSGLSMLGSGLLSADTLTGTNLTTYLNGSGSLAVRHAKGDKMEAKLLGSGKQELGGKTTSSTFSIEGSGTVEAYPLASSQATVNITGSATCYVWVDNSLSVRIDGSGKVLYKGPASQIQKTIIGDGTVALGN